jgi:hypothetical protein
MQDKPRPDEMTSTQLYDRAADLLFRAMEAGHPSRQQALKRQASRFRKLGELREAEELGALREAEEAKQELERARIERLSPLARRYGHRQRSAHVDPDAERSHGPQRSLAAVAGFSATVASITGSGTALSFCQREDWSWEMPSDESGLGPPLAGREG